MSFNIVMLSVQECHVSHLNGQKIVITTSEEHATNSLCEKCLGCIQTEVFLHHGFQTWLFFLCCFQTMLCCNCFIPIYFPSSMWCFPHVLFWCFWTKCRLTLLAMLCGRKDTHFRVTWGCSLDHSHCCLHHILTPGPPRALFSFPVPFIYIDFYPAFLQLKAMHKKANNNKY